MSGRRAIKFTSGWALPIGTFGKAHYFERAGLGLARSLCGAMEGPAGGLFDAGDWRRCKRCATKLAVKEQGL